MSERRARRLTVVVECDDDFCDECRFVVGVCVEAGVARCNLFDERLSWWPVSERYERCGACTNSEKRHP